MTNTTPVIIKKDLLIEWNNKKMLEYIKEQCEPYKGLIVTEENLKDMQKTKREITSIRTSLSKFGVDVRRELKKPVDTFNSQLKEVQDLVLAVEVPITNQLSVYETERVDKLTEEIWRELEAKSVAAGLKEQYYETIQVPSKWLNVTQNWADTTIAIDGEIAKLLLAQKEADDRIKLQKSINEMAETLLSMFNMNYGLNSPVTMAEIQTCISADFADMKEKIETMFVRRAEIEMAAIEESKKEEIKPPNDLKEHLIVHEPLESFNPIYRVTAMVPADKLSQTTTVLRRLGIKFESEELH